MKNNFFKKLKRCKDKTSVKPGPDYKQFHVVHVYALRSEPQTIFFAFSGISFIYWSSISSQVVARKKTLRWMQWYVIHLSVIWDTVEKAALSPSVWPSRFSEQDFLR